MIASRRGTKERKMTQACMGVGEIIAIVHTRLHILESLSGSGFKAGAIFKVGIFSHENIR